MSEVIGYDCPRCGKPALDEAEWANHSYWHPECLRKAREKGEIRESGLDNSLKEHGQE